MLTIKNILKKTVKSYNRKWISSLKSVKDRDYDPFDELNEYKRINFVDKVSLVVQGGKGGNGCISYEELTPGKRRATGGSGGKGGNVYVRSNKLLYNLSFDSVSINAKSGNNGKGDGMTGKDGDDVIIEEPLGTVITEILPEFYDDLITDDLDDDDDDNDDDINSSGNDDGNYEDDKNDDDDLSDNDDDDSEEDDHKNRMGNKFEFTKHGQVILVASGGLPGLGNKVTAGSNKLKKKSMPATKIPGQPGQKRTVLLELKLIADVGLVGYPNAGKSSLLRALSNARPRVAAYPFTTLHPHIGVVEYSDFDRVTVADIPGIIEGAHTGRGLGLDFLKHIERTKALLYVIDAASTEYRQPVNDLLSLRNELKSYDSNLLNKPSAVLANKSDLNVRYSHMKSLKEFCRKYKMKLLIGSGISGAGVSQLATEIRLLKEFADKQNTNV